ncbi:hypothetical protein LNV07_25190 [Paucibacter oligotrophus]|uniref:Uncharacterized protein n=1 Tax=Roseateles oligotrophus TaxID=1769250 RepID=A0ABT2YND0_9BURK|nr:hypothetical protein [Roseateles oligotrophus]
MQPKLKPRLEDKRLERLYDYTKFHIGIYLSAAAGLTGLLGSIANQKAGQFLFDLVGAPPLLGLALVLMVLAGACGGVVATSVTESRKFDDFWKKPQGPSWWRQGPVGAKWVAAEHSFFWMSLVSIITAVLWRKQTLEWFLPL